jgi:hypothetical protein
MFRAHRPIHRRIHTAVHTTIGSVAVPFGPRALYVVAGLGDCSPRLATTYRTRNPNNTATEPMVVVNSCVNSPEDGPVDPKHVEICRYMNKIEIVTPVCFSFHILKGCTVQKD